MTDRRVLVLLLVCLNITGISPKRGRIISETELEIETENESVNRALLQNEAEDEADSRIKSDDRIVGGSQAFHGQFPFIASLKRGSPSSLRWFCGGAAIAHNYVITAAHCVDDYSHSTIYRLYVTIGDHNRRVKESQEQTIQADKIILHRRFNDNTFENDIALIKLKQSIRQDNYKQFISLMPSVDTMEEELRRNSRAKMTVIGWGTTSWQGQTSQYLRYVEVPYVQRSRCRKLMSGLNIFRSNICAGDVRGGKDSCQGDSGGPLVYRTSGLSSSFTPSSPSTSNFPSPSNNPPSSSFPSSSSNPSSTYFPSSPSFKPTSSNKPTWTPGSWFPISSIPSSSNNPISSSPSSSSSSSSPFFPSSSSNKPTWTVGGGIKPGEWFRPRKAERTGKISADPIDEFISNLLVSIDGDTDLESVVISSPDSKGRNLIDDYDYYYDDDNKEDEVPVVAGRASHQWTLGGVVSNGVKCATPGKAGIYTNVAFYRDWIQNNMRYN